MFDLKKYFNEIESYKFSTKVNVTSSISIVEQIIKNDNTVCLIKEKCKEDSSAIKLIFNRVKTLTKISNNSQYESEWDSALMAYLFILNDFDTKLAYDASTMVLEMLDSTWWAKCKAIKIKQARKEIE